MKYVIHFFPFHKWLLPKISIENWDGWDVVRTRAVIRQRLQCIKPFMENCVGAKHISFKNSMFGEQLVWAEHENNCCKTNVKELL